MLWTQVITGFEVDELTAVRVLDAATWKQRRQRLQELGGPPDGEFNAGKTDIGKVESPEPKEVVPKVDVPRVEPKESIQILRVSSDLNPQNMLSKVRNGCFMKAHDVKLSAGLTYTIDMESAKIDSYLILEDEKGNILAQDDDGGGFPNARIEFRPHIDGNYRIIATTFPANQTGDYTLTVRQKVVTDKK